MAVKLQHNVNNPIPVSLKHLFGASPKGGLVVGTSEHCNPAAQDPQKKLLSGLKQLPHSSPSCLTETSTLLPLHLSEHSRPPFPDPIQLS